MVTFKSFQASALVLSAAVGVAACGSGGGTDGTGGDDRLGLRPTPIEKLALNQGVSCDGLKDYVGDSIADLILNDGFPVCLGCEVTIAGAPSVDPTTDSADGFDNVTGTNNQETGVDELDIVEVDQDGYFYILDGDHLVVATGVPPAELREVAAVKLPDGFYGEGLLLDESQSRLAIVMAGFGPPEIGPAVVAPPSHPSVDILFMDVGDPASPVLQRQVSVDGFQLATRRIGSRLHLFSHFTPAMPDSIADDDILNGLRGDYQDAKAGGPGDVDALEQQIRERVAVLVGQTDGQAYLPSMTRIEGDIAEDLTPANCSNVAIPDVSSAFAITTILSMDTNGQDLSSLAVVNNSWNVYASLGNAYLIQTSGGWWWDDLQAQQTAIYKIAIGDSAPTYRGLGVVDGWTASGFQFSEHNGFLRVTTNRSERDPVADQWLQHNHLFVLEDNGAGTLQVVGSVRAFAPDETIFAARFFGDRGFVVTFRQIDPLFAFDLSDPRDPRLMGETEIPGVSTYLHPLDDTHLLTIGIDGDDLGLNGKIQLQIFDVQDLSAPRRVHALVPDFNADGLAWSSAVYDHRAFNFYSPDGLLTIPVQYSASRLDEHFSGFAAFRVSAGFGFEEIGRLDHSDLARDQHCPAVVDGSCDDGVYLEAATPARAITASYAGETLIYTLSDVGMRVSSAQDFENPIATLPLTYGNHYWWSPIQ